jgi:arginase
VSGQQTLAPVSIIGAGLDLGAGRRGVDMGPSAIRYAGLDERLRRIGRDVVDRGDVGAAVPEAVDLFDARARYLPQILETSAHIADLVEEVRREGSVPLVLGGDHSIAMGTLGGMARAGGAPGGVLWVDAHGDANTPNTSSSGNVHGMPLAAALGLGGPLFERAAFPIPSVDRVAMIGLRDLDEPERELLRTLEGPIFTMSELDKIGVETAMRQSLEYLSGSPWVHLSFDMDAVDPDFAPGVGTPVRGGLSYREAHLALELLAESGLLDSIEVVEVNPILDRENATGRLAVELAASALGARIL